MNPLGLALLALATLPALACCGTPEQRSAAAPTATAAPAAEQTKLEAPVEIDAKLAEGTARVTLRFTSPATGVRVDVSGVDGLAVTSAPTLVDGASFDRGAEAAFDVAFTPGPGRSFLAVAVRGVFGGGHLGKARSFAVGSPVAEPEKAHGLTVETPDGERVKIVVPGR